MRQRSENNHAHSIEQHEENPTIPEINDDEIWMPDFAQPYNEVIPSCPVSDRPWGAIEQPTVLRPIFSIS